MRGALAARGGTTFRHLSLEFRIIDGNRDQKLTLQEFKTGLCQMGCRHFGWSAVRTLRRQPQAPAHSWSIAASG